MSAPSRAEISIFHAKKRGGRRGRKTRGSKDALGVGGNGAIKTMASKSGGWKRGARRLWDDEKSRITGEEERRLEDKARGRFRELVGVERN